MTEDPHRRCREALESVRDLSRNHSGAVALARYWLDLLFGTPVTSGRPSSHDGRKARWEHVHEILHLLPIGEKVEVEGLTWTRRDRYWLVGPDGHLYDAPAATTVVVYGSPLRP